MPSTRVSAQLEQPLYPRDHQVFNLILRHSDDPDLLTPREAALRQKLLDVGVDPLRGGRPTTLSHFQRYLADQVGWDLLALPRQVEILEIDWERGLAIVFRFPETNLFYTDVDTNVVGIAFEAPRDMADSTLGIDVSSIEAWQREWVAVGLQDQLRRQLASRSAAAAQQHDLLNFTIPVQLPRTIERVIGRGDATSIRISGQLNFKLGGRSTVRSDFVPNEIQASQSLFPSLEMEQSLRVNMDGQVGEKIKVKVRHDSNQIGAQATEVKIAFEGDEDDIIRTIRAGNIDVTLPGSRLLGVGANKGGLFGVKVVGAVGPVDFTLLTSKEQSQSNEQNFSQSGGAEDEFVIDAWDYARHRFFTLNAPAPVYFADQPGAPADEFATRFLPNWEIDAASISVYTQAAPGPGDENFFDFGVAYVDTSGIGWEGFDPVTGQVTDALTASELLSLGRKRVRRDRWRRLVPDEDWTVLQDATTGKVIGIQMSKSYLDVDVLAVTYNIVDEENRVVRKVGRSVDDPGGATIDDPEEPGSPIFFFKLLKDEGDPYDPTQDIFNPTALTWEYELRNYYDLRGRGIAAEGFDFRIERNLNSLDNPQLDEELGEQNLPWFRIFGLDQVDASGNPGADDKPDITDNNIFNLNAGILQFPSRTPFAPSSADLSRWSGGDVTSLVKGDLDLATPEIYRRNLTNQEDRSNASKFRLVVKQTSVSSRLRLNAFNIQEGSEEVSLNGRVLQRDIDYTIDYFSGEVNLIGEAAASLNAQTNISVKFEVDPLFGGGRTSLSGMNLTYHLGTQNQMSTTWLLQSKPNNSSKPRLGEEPSKSWVGNLSGKFHLEPGWVRSLANLLPRVNSDQQVAINFDGEVAVSVPNPNTKNVAYVEDFESVDQSVNVSMSTDGWIWASLPAEYEKGLGHRDYGPEDRAYAGWHRAQPGVKREYLNPTLSDQERRDIVPAMELRVVSTDTTGTWRPNEYAGIMRSLGGEVDLSQSQFLEFWVDDGTGNVAPDSANRPGILHFDFGFINEDSFWKKDADGNWILGKFDQEDRDNDGVLNQLTEDTGLDGIKSGDPNEQPLIPNRPPLPGTNDQAGDDFSADPGNEKIFLYINGTEGNRKLDTEDINRNGVHDLTDGYFSLSVDLADTVHALVDIYRDYADRTSFIEESARNNRAWRKYRLDLRSAVTRRAGLVDGRIPGTSGAINPYSPFAPDLSRVRTLRIWYEDPSGQGPAERRIRLTEMRFLGNRWLNDRIRTVDDRIIPPAILGSEEFRLGVLNNKDNPEYRPPVFPDTRNNVAEKEQSLEFIYRDLEPGHMVRARKEIPGRLGQDFTVYRELNFFWREPRTRGLYDPQQGVLEAFYWVGSDSLNYYEIAFPFNAVDTDADGWQECRIDLAEMTNVKFNPLEDLNPGVEGTPQVRRGTVFDRLTREPYVITVRGRPDLTRVQRFYAGVRYPTWVVGPSGVGPKLSGEVLFNEIRLKEVDDRVGHAQRYATSVLIPGLADIQVDWSQTDAEFRGLNATKGSQVLQRRWSARASSRLQNFIPTMGLEIPFSLSRRVELGLPKFAPRTDIELIDPADQDSLRTEAVTDAFNFQVRKKNPSQYKLMRVFVDPFQYALSGSRAVRLSPTRDSRQESADTKINYDLRLRNGLTFKVPFTRTRIRYLPTQITAASSWRWDQQKVIDKRTDGTLIPRVPQLTKSSVNNLTLIFQPTQALQGNLAVSSNRNLILGSQKFLGLDVGREVTFSQGLTLTYKPGWKLLRWAKPNVDYKVGYTENRRPGVRQSTPNVGLPDAEDGFLGKPGQVRDMTSNQDITVKGQLDLFSWLKKRFDKKSTAPPPSTARRRNQRQRGQLGRAARTLPPPAAVVPPPTPGAAAADSSAQAGESEPGIDPGVDPGEAPVPEEGTVPAPPSPATEEFVPPVREEPVDSGVEVFEDEADSLGEGEPEFRPGEAFAALVRPFKNLFVNLQPIRSTWTRNRATNYTRVNKRADSAYRFGFTARPQIAPSEELIVGRNNDGTFQTQPFNSERREYRTRYSLNSQSQVFRDVRVDLSYTRQSGRREGTRGASANYNWEMPLGIRISRVHEWRIFGDLFSASSIDVNLRRSKRVDRIVTGQTSFPKTTWAIQPRWTFRFQNELDANLNVNFSRDSTPSSASILKSRQLRVDLKLQKNFDANGRLAFLRFGQRGTGTTIDMNVNVAFSSQRSARVVTGSNIEDQPRGRDTLSVTPQFSYQFNRNLRAGLQLEFSRSKDITRNATTKTFGLFFDATMTF